MWPGVGEYLLLSAAIGLVFHAISRRYGACVVVGALIATVGNLVHEAWRADWNVNPGWMPPLLLIGFVLAAAANALVGWPFVLIRHLRSTRTGA